MSLTNQQRLHLSLELYNAPKSCRTLSPLTECLPDINIEDAYHISQNFLEARCDRDGETIMGKKIGVTLTSVLEMLGVFQADVGFLANT